MSNAPDPAIVTAGTARTNAVVSPQNGMAYPVTAPADPTGRIQGAAQILLQLNSAAYTSAQSPQVFNTTYVNYLALDMTLTSFTGGTSPTVTFFLERLGADGPWYQILTTSALSTAQTISVDISPGLNGSASGPLSSTVQHAVLTQSARLRWAFGGTVSPTAVTFSASIIGR